VPDGRKERGRGWRHHEQTFWVIGAIIEPGSFTPDGNDAK
jgi:hypothetical protein